MDERTYGLADLVDALVDARRGRSEPFLALGEALGVERDALVRLIEAPPALGRLVRHHGEHVSSAAAALREAVREVGVDLLVFLLQVPRGLTVSDADRPWLGKHFPRHDDPDDW